LTENAAFNFGGVRYPLATQASGANLLETCDPSLAKLIAFVESVLTTHMGEALVGAAASVAPITDAVAMTISINPADVSKVDQLDFPLVAIWRKGSEKSSKTTNWVKSDWLFGAAFILPPLSAEQSIQLHPILNSVEQIITNRLHLGYDPSFNDGERILEAAGIAACRVTKSEIGRWDVSNELDFHGWFGELAVSEQEMPNSEGMHPLTGGSLKITDGTEQPSNPVDAINARL
jgi:hypothetical protein